MKPTAFGYTRFGFAMLMGIAIIVVWRQSRETGTNSTMTNGRTDPEGQLVLYRNSEREVFPIVETGWDLRDEGTERARLSVYIGCGRAIVTLSDSQSLRAEPFWELVAVEPGLSLAALTPGKVFTIPHSKAPLDETFGGTYTNFYYAGHERTERNKIRIIDVEQDRLLVEVYGQCDDVNYYDGSKPQNQITARTWLNR